MKNLILSLYAILLLNIASFATQLSGTYTVNPAGAATTTNFKNVGSAIGFMSGASRTDGGPNNSSPFGVSGPVIFEITPGNYPEIIYFNTIGGVSLINTITLQKLTGSTGEIIFNPTNTSNLTIFNFNSQAGKFVNFKNLRFQPIITSSIASTSFCIGVGSNINVDNCIFDFANSATNSVYGIYNCNEVVVTNSTFYNSLTTTKYTGSVMGYGSYCNFNNNVVKNMAFSVAGIRTMNNNLFQQSAISITGDFASPGSFADNTLTNATLNFSYINNNQTFTIQRNKINVNRRYFPDLYSNSGDAITDPISFANNGTAGCTVKCINNFIAINQNMFNGPVSGINAGQGVPYALQIFHNTVMVNSIQPDVFPITASTGATVTNNIFWSNTGSKAAINLGAVWNANNYYATILPAYTHTDANARTENIVFTSASDLHHNTACIKGIATSVITDIDNLPRSASTPIMGATEATNLSIDGGARRIISPVTIINAGVASSQAISFKLVNLGSTTINNVTANYTVNNGTATSETITGLNVAACDSSTVTFTTPYSFNPNVGSNIKVTVTQVNNITDANVTNDIAQKYIEVLGPMNGTYTVNPAAPQTPSNFQTIGYADSSMMARSITGPVTISIYNGIYAQTGMTLGAVTGSSPTNTITFTSFSNDSVQTQITKGFTITGVSNVFIKKLNFDSLIINGNVSDYSITNNQIRTFNWLAGNNIVFNSNYIKPQTSAGSGGNPGPGISFGSKSGAYINNITVEKNIFSSVPYINNAGVGTGGVSSAVSWSKVNKPTLRNNIFKSINMVNVGYSLIGCCTYVPFPYGSTFQFDRCTDTAFVEGNKFEMISTDRLLNDIDLVGNTSTPRLSLIVVRNNFFTVSGQLSYNPYGNGAASVEMYYNNFNNIGTGSGVLLDNKIIALKNNIFSSTNGKKAFSYSSHPGAANYNNFYTSGSVLVQATSPSVVNYATLAQYQTASSTNANSKTVNPKYIDSANLHIQHPSLLASGVAYPTVNPILFDIDNDNRNSLNPAIGADEPMLPSNDVVAKLFLTPKTDFAGNVAQPLNIKILNNGSAVLNQVNVRWSVNGTEQLPAYSWSGSLAYDSSTTINFGSYIFPMMKYTNFKVWTDLPNAAPDMVPANDTLRIDSIMPFARGNFTLGGGSPTVPSFTKANEYLNYGGVDSAVNILVRNGKYTEQPTLKYTRGASLTNQITFKGENNNASLDTLAFSATGTGINPLHVLKLDSAAFIKFKNISFQSTAPNYYTTEINLSNKTRFISFDSCVFTAIANDYSYFHIEHNNILSSIDSNFIFTNNSFYGGNGGIKMYAANVLIKGNRFEGFGLTYNTGTGIDITPVTNSYLTIDSNFIKNPIACTYYSGTCITYGTSPIFGIKLSYYNGANADISITRNKIYAFGNAAFYNQANGSATNPIKLYNNFFSTRNSFCIYAGGGYLDFLNNSIADSSDNANNSLILIAGNNINFKNNIAARKLANADPNFRLVDFNSSSYVSTFASSNNAYFIADTSKTFYNGSANLSLSAWKALGKDANSKKITPAFISYLSDLHIDKNKAGAVDVFKAATPLTVIPKDIDDSTRSLTNPSIGADEFSLNNIDAGAVAVTNLGLPLALGINNVIASIRNYGNNNITAANVNWSVNGAIQTPYSWTGNLSTGDSAVNITIGNFNFTGINKYDIKVWTSTAGDVNAVNDTAYKTVYPALCGNYTIAGTTPDFLNMATAANYASFAGVTCPVVFNIRNGQYLESDTINFIPGASAINTVTFQSQSLDSSKVAYYQSESIFNTTTPTYTYSNSAAVLRINGAQFVKFKALTFKRTPDATYHFYLDVINLVGNASGTSFSNCDISTPGPGKLITASALTASSDYNLSNNLFTGGTNAFFMTYPYGGVISKINIKDNKFMKPVGPASPALTYTVDMGNMGNNPTTFNIENNYFDSCVQRSAVGAINATYSLGKITILKNIIIKRKGADGIHLENSGGGSVADSALLVANNFITIDSAVAGVGIYAYSMKANVKIVYNNILNNSTNSNSRALQFYIYDAVTTLKDTIANNNLFNTQAGHSLYLQQNTVGSVQCNNNNIFATGGAVLANYQGTNYTTIPAFQTAGGTFVNNVSKNPLYISATDLHVLELSLRTNGTPLSYVPKDIDNDTRGLINTTIGADEIVVSTLDMGVSALVTPIIPFAAGNQNITVTLKNYGITPITNTTVNWSVNGTAQTPFNYTGSIAFGNTANAVIANYNFVVDSAYTIKFWTSNPNGSVDNNLTNDSTIVSNFYPALNGVYTLGGTTPDFKSFVRSTANLKYGGMLGNVIFNARDGIYNEAMRVDSIPFQNNYNATWQSESGDSSKVVIAYTATLNDNVIGVLQFDKAKNIIIKKMTIQAKLPLNNYYTAPSFKSVIYFSTKNKNIQLLSNQIIDSTTVIGTTFADGCLLIYNNDATVYGNVQRSKDSAILIDRNLFKETNNNSQVVIDLSGYVQYNFDGSSIISSNYLNNCTISNNSFDLLDISKLTLYVANVDSLKVISNKITGRSVLSGKDYLLVDKNDFYTEGVGSTLVTINAGTNRAVNKPCIISNNMMQAKLFGSTNGVAPSNYALSVSGDRVNIIHNTMATSDTGYVTGYAYGAALGITGNLDTIKNNIFYNRNGGNLLSTSCTNLTSNNNDYVYTNHFSTNANSLAQYRIVTGQDGASVQNINPYFRGPKDLHASNILLKNASAVSPPNILYTSDFDGQSRGATSCYGADEFLQPVNDMVVLDASPKKIFPEGLNDVKIHVYNNGSNPITSFTATAGVQNYTEQYGLYVNAGTLNYNFTGNIAPGAEGTITLGQINIPMRRNSFKVNTYNLNGVGDEVPFTDSLQNDNFYAGLNGTYTFRDGYSYNPGAVFNTFVSTATQLKLGGVYGPSTLNLLPGIYDNYFNIDSIPSRGNASPLTVQSQNGDTATTGFKMFYTQYHAIQMFRANNVTIKNLRFESNPAYSCINTGWNSQNITIQNCLFKAPAQLYTGNYQTGNGVVIVGNWAGQTGFTDSNYIVKNNVFNSGYKGIYSLSNDAKPIYNTQIKNNIFINQGITGIQYDGGKNIIIDSNSISTNTTDTSFVGILTKSFLGKSAVTKNSIFIETDGTGIATSELGGYFANPTDTLLTANNFITTGYIKASVGIDLQQNQNRTLQVYHNSVLNRSNSAMAVGLRTYLNAATTAKFEAMNNIFYNKLNGYALFTNRTASTLYVEHNENIFTGGVVLGQVNGANYNNLAALSASGIAYNSVSGDPVFVSDKDLHADGGIVNNSGSYDAYNFVKNDIDNDARSNSNPDIGADEFNLPDYGIVQLESPQSSCSHTATEIVKVYVKNFGLTPRSKIPVAYRINGGMIVRDTANILLNAGDSALFTFAQTANLSAPINYNFELWSDYRGDSLRINDTLKTLVATTPANNVLPYYTGFEGTAAGWYTGGQNSSFKWGVIFSGIIDSAANGLNAWKTNLTGPYKNNELSYFYSPCFDMSAVIGDPVLNFNFSHQLETNNDKAWVEMSSDAGATWSKLGVQGEGLKWYNNGGNYWTGLDNKWHNVKHSLPITALGDKSKVRIRFVLQTNGTVVQDGVAIDDISIYTGANPPVSNGTYTNRTAVSTGTGTFIPVNDPSGNRLVEINDAGQALGNITVDVNQTTGGIPTTYNGQNYLGRSFVIHVQNQPATPVTVRLFITQAEVDAWKLLDPTIDIMRNISVQKYSSNVLEDFDITNNNSGTTLNISPAQLTKLPYQDGYIIEFQVSSFSEFRLTKGTPPPATCLGNGITMTAATTGTIYQWQADTGSGYSNISNGSNYIGTSTATLQINNVPTSISGYKYRCVVDAVNGPDNVLRFILTWTGAVNNDWALPSNWSCSTIPDEFTEVVIPAGLTNYPVIANSTSVRKIELQAGTSLNVASGVVLGIKGK